MPSVYPADFDPIPLPDFDSPAPTGALGQPARPAGAFLTDVVDSVKAVQQSLGTASAPGPLLDAAAGADTLVADSTGLADASVAIQTWAESLVSGNSSGYAPPGDYLLSSPITLTGLNDARFGIRGAGVGLTRFIVPASNTSGAFLFDGVGSPRDCEIHFSDFSIVTQGVGQGTGIQFAMSAGGNQHNRSVSIESVRVYGEDETQHCFDIGIDVSHTWRPYLRDVTVGGPFGPGITDDLTDASPSFTATAALVLDDAYAWHVTDCNFWSAHTGIRDIGDLGEGGRLINTQIVSVRVALDRQRTGPEPSLIIQGCHWNYRDTGLNINGGKIVRIIGNHPYCQDTANDYSGVSRDIYLRNTERCIIAENNFHYAAVADRINIHIDGSTLGRDSTIANNIFGSGGNNAILLSTATTGITLLGNQYPGTYTKRVLDNSGIAVILDSVGGAWRMSHQGNGATIGPELQMVRDSLTPAANDVMGGITFVGKDSAAAEASYASIRSHITDPTDASEAGALSVWVAVGGTLTRIGQFDNPATSAGTALNIQVNRSGVFSVDRVTIGAADSGGAGFKVLRVPN